MTAKMIVSILLPLLPVATGGGPAVTSGNGPAVCNCSQNEAVLTVGHSQTVSVTVGGGSASISVATGQTGSATQAAQPGQCSYLQYNFHCEPGWFGWTCTLSSSSLKTRRTTADDCR